jgi:hypothetical protein
LDIYSLRKLSTTGWQRKFDRRHCPENIVSFTPFKDITVADKHGSKPVDLTDKKFQGCIIAPLDITTNAQLPIKDDGTCSTLLGDACIAEINSRISRVSVSSTDNPCDQIQAAFGLSHDAKNSNCTAAQWGATFSEPFLPDSATCKAPSSTEGTLVAHYSENKSPSPADDFSLYDNSVGIPRPFIFAVWENKTDVSGAATISWQTKVVCIPADNVVKGSRTLPVASTTTETGKPKPTKKGNAATRGVEVVGMGMLPLVGLTILFCTVM